MDEECTVDASEPGFDNQQSTVSGKILYVTIVMNYDLSNNFSFAFSVLVRSLVHILLVGTNTRETNCVMLLCRND